VSRPRVAVSGNAVSPLPAAGARPVAGHEPVSFAEQLHGYIVSRFPLSMQDRAGDYISGAFLTFFGGYLGLHIIAAWPHIVAALQGRSGGAL
jgi:hypothetical protein